MAKSHKRSEDPEETMGTNEAASLLGVSVRTIREYVSQGLLRPLKGSGPGKVLVSLQDVSAMAGTILNGFDFVKVAKTAIHALVSSTRAERRLDRVEALLGVDSAHLETTEEAVLSFYHQSVDLLADYVEDMPPEEVLDWAYKLSNVTEEYLTAVKLHTGNQEPWVPFMDAAQKLYDCAPRASFRYRKDLEVAYGYISAARRHLRQVSYFYIRKEHGAYQARDAFPEMSLKPRDERILQLIFMMKQK